MLKFYFNLQYLTVPWYFIKCLDLDTCSTYSLRNNIIRTPTQYHSFATDNRIFECIRVIQRFYNIVMNKIYTHSYIGFSFYVKGYILKTYKIKCNVGNYYSYRNDVDVI